MTISPRPTVHVTFGYSAAGSLRQALKMAGRGEAGQIEMRCDMETLHGTEVRLPAT